MHTFMKAATGLVAIGYLVSLSSASPVAIDNRDVAVDSPEMDKPGVQVQGHCCTLGCGYCLPHSCPQPGSHTEECARGVFAECCDSFHTMNSEFVNGPEEIPWDLLGDDWLGDAYGTPRSLAKRTVAPTMSVVYGSTTAPVTTSVTSMVASAAASAVATQTPNPDNGCYDGDDDCNGPLPGRPDHPWHPEGSQGQPTGYCCRAGCVFCRATQKCFLLELGCSQNDKPQFDTCCTYRPGIVWVPDDDKDPAAIGPGPGYPVPSEFPMPSPQIKGPDDDKAESNHNTARQLVPPATAAACCRGDCKTCSTGRRCTLGGTCWNPNTHSVFDTCCPITDDIVWVHQGEIGPGPEIIARDGVEDRSNDDGSELEMFGNCCQDDCKVCSPHHKCYFNFPFSSGCMGAGNNSKFNTCCVPKAGVVWVTGDEDGLSGVESS
ncbi:hypothetical protein V8F20_001429 [Naviculisporaceae sp. PSN 640]